MRGLAKSALFVCLVLAGYVAGSAGPVQSAWMRLAGRSASTAAERPPALKAIETGGEQMVLIYFGKSRCAWSNHADLPEALRSIRLALDLKAADRNESLVFVGSALDSMASEGIRHLSRIGQFDEVASGYGWANSVALSRLWGGYGPPVSTPQLLLLRRELVVERLPGTLLYSVRNERLLARKTGLHQILAWAAAGAPIPK